MAQRQYLTEDGIIFCFEEEEWLCYVLLETNDDLRRPEDVLGEPNEFQDSSTVFVEPPRRVAGVTTNCFRIEFSGEDALTDIICLSEEGIPLYQETRTRDGKMIQEATEAKDEASADD